MNLFYNSSNNNRMKSIIMSIMCNKEHKLQIMHKNNNHLIPNNFNKTNNNHKILININNLNSNSNNNSKIILKVMTNCLVK